MILVVDERLFASESARDVDLLSLLRLAGLRGHGLLIQANPRPACPPSDADRAAVWCQSLHGRVAREAQVLLELVRNLSASMTTWNADRVLVSDRWDCPRGECRLTLAEALRVLGEPLHVLVENGLRDAAFLRRVMPAAWRARISEWEKAGRVRFEHGGGISELAEIVSFMGGKAGAEETWGTPTGAWQLIHFVVFDHDGDAPHTPSKQATKLKEICRSQGLSKRSHMLERRRQEYYLPREAMERLACEQLTDRQQKDDTMAAIGAFFSGGQRRHGELPGPVACDWWKNRFWFHRDQTPRWPDLWFSMDGAWQEMTRLAEALERAL